MNAKLKDWHKPLGKMQVFGRVKKLPRKRAGVGVGVRTALKRDGMLAEIMRHTEIIKSSTAGIGLVLQWRGPALLTKNNKRFIEKIS